MNAGATIHSDPATPAAPSTQALTDLTAPGLWRRMACWTYESVLLFAVVFLPAYLFSSLSQMRNAIDPIRLPLLQAFMFIVLGLYFVWFWIHGQTLAMKTWRIRVVDRVGQPLRQGRALWRYLLSWIWLLPPLAVMAALRQLRAVDLLLLPAWWIVWALLARFHPQRQFWHDAWAGTRLIPSKPMSRR
ncbi:RDD family protein [Variovorax robiniae]|uniref:RDD family protein n=1 Tax=Variovorax robiniae TaxID=1836199 RepID=A0ABU8XGB8_9BURK